MTALPGASTMAEELKMIALSGASSMEEELEWPEAPAREMLDWGTFDIQLMRPPDTDYRPHDHMFIKISSKFAKPPVIILGLTSLEVEPSTGCVRVDAFVENIHKHIFDAHIRSWNGTKLYQAGCTWLAMPSEHPHFQAGKFDTSDPAWKPENCITHREIVFPNPYEAPPKVVLWFNLLDISSLYNERIMTFATNVTRAGFTAHINPWGDTQVYGAVISWFAYPAGYPGICSGTVLPENGTSGVVEFEKKFTNPPTTVLVGLNKLDCDKQSPCSFNIITEAVSEVGLGIRVEGFHDTVLHSAGVTYIAIE